MKNQIKMEKIWNREGQNFSKLETEKVKSLFWSGRNFFFSYGYFRFLNQTKVLQSFYNLSLCNNPIYHTPVRVFWKHLLGVPSGRK